MIIDHRTSSVSRAPCTWRSNNFNGSLSNFFQQLEGANGRESNVASQVGITLKDVVAPITTTKILLPGTRGERVDNSTKMKR